MAVSEKVSGREMVREQNIGKCEGISFSLPLSHSLSKCNAVVMATGGAAFAQSINALS